MSQTKLLYQCKFSLPKTSMYESISTGFPFDSANLAKAAERPCNSRYRSRNQFIMARQQISPMLTFQANKRAVASSQVCISFDIS